MSKPFEGIRVMVHGRFAAGPLIGTQLADFGAEVIRYEDPQVMDFIRESPPFIKKDGKRISIFFGWMSRNTKSITLNLRKEGGKAAFKEMAKTTDIIIDNHVPGVMDNWGVGYDVIKKINPGIIWVGMSTHGQTGPYSKKPGYDILAQGWGGLMDLNGFPDGPPLRLPVAMSDLLGSLCGIYGTLTALVHKLRTGEGQMVDVSLFESSAFTLNGYVLQYTALGTKHTRMGNKWGWGAYGPFKARDGYVIIATALDRQWYKLCEIMGREELIDDPKFKTVAGRSYEQNGDEVDAIVQKWVETMEAKEVENILDKERIPVGPVNDIPAVVNDPHYNARGNIEEIEQPGIGKIRFQGPVPKLSRTPGKVETPAPELGEHNDYVYRELLGYSEEKIAELKEEGAI